MAHSLPPDVAVALASILNAAEWPEAPLDLIGVRDGAAVFPVSMPIEAMATAAQAAVGLGVAALWRNRTEKAQAVTVDRRAAGLSMAGADYLRIDGREEERWADITGFYPARDGRWVYLHGNFPHLRDGLLKLLGAENKRDSVARTVSGWDAFALEDAAADAGLCGVAVRNREEWEAHPQFEAISWQPLVSIERIGDAPPEPLPPGPRPLSGLRMLDLSRVIAGPQAGRTFAEHGATVMRVASPNLPFLDSLVIDTGTGKRSCHIDLDRADGVDTLKALTASADVFLDAYRPGALAARGFGAEDLAALRPGIVAVSLCAWSHDGPWRGRRGYDSLVQGPTGLALVDRSDGRPVRLPCQPLDYLTGFLAAFGAMVALDRRSCEGGSWQVRVSLACSAAWMWRMTDLLGPKSDIPARRPEVEDIPDRIRTMDSAFGRIGFLRSVLEMPNTPPGWDRPPVPLGSDPPVWPD